MDRIKNTIKLIPQKVFFLYIIVLAVSCFFIDFEKVKGRYKAERLNELLPEFSYLAQYEIKRGDFDKDKLKDYLQYYKAVHNFFPERSGPAGMLGYLYAHEGDWKKSVMYLKKSVALNPHMFWFQYDLGIMYYRQGLFAEAADAFNNALAADVRKTVYFLAKSRMYERIFMGTTYEYDFANRYAEAKQRTYKFLAFCFDELGEYLKLENLSLFAQKQQFADREFFNYFSGKAAYHQGEFMKAANIFEKVIAGKPEFIEAHYYMGLSMNEMGQRDLSTRFLQKAAALRKENKPVLDKLDKAPVQLF